MKSVLFCLLFTISSFSQSFLNLHFIDGSYKNASLGVLSKISLNYTNSSMDFHMTDGNIFSEALSEITNLSLSNVPLGIPLPVELVYFTALVNGNTVTLKWTTNTELNNYGFEVERSDEVINQWKKCGFVKGNNNSNSTINYSFSDKPLGSSKFYYRLKQIDSDGNFKYSDIINVDLTSPVQYNLLQNYPNPFNPETNITYNISSSGIVILKIYDILGNEIKTLVNSFHNPGTYSISFNANELSTGFYICKMQVKEFSSTIKMLLLK